MTRRRRSTVATRRAAATAGRATTATVSASTTAVTVTVTVAITAVRGARARATAWATVPAVIVTAVVSAAVVAAAASTTVSIAISSVAVTTSATGVKFPWVVGPTLLGKLHAQIATLKLLTFHAVNGIFCIAFLHKANKRKATRLVRATGTRNVHVADLAVLGKEVTQLVTPIIQGYIRGEH
ncbi:hypothetical protein PsorP6_011243 [Peronosclerospora sorghi]|uniref:Uncharacterized protein n=1 Tax=Peronosclerospora sorghi TaxID=230839 RepID=A0ACC0WI36_9STRA|nr:hypothetical protein PsorP6_011243 [Peronosclerospora sorghi]